MLQDVEAHPTKVNWAVLVRNLLSELGFYEVWVQQGVGNYNHTGQRKRTGGCYNELVVAFFSTGDGIKGKKIYTF